MDNTNKAFSCLGAVVFAIVAVVGEAIMNGWVLSILWGWFVSPLFGLKELAIAPAIGFSLVVGMLTHQESGEQKERSNFENVVLIFGRAVVSPLITLFIGWIVYQFI